MKTLHQVVNPPRAERAMLVGHGGKSGRGGVQLERLTRGLKSRSYVPGPLAPDDFEGTLWDIWQYLARRLGGSADGVNVGTVSNVARGVK